jgi:hypothetical protein
MVRPTPIGDTSLSPAARSILAEAARAAGATLDSPAHSPPEDSTHAPLTADEKLLLGSKVRGSEIYRGQREFHAKYPANETMAMVRRPFQKPRNFLNPAPLISGRAAVPPPPRCYPVAAARAMEGVCTPTLIENNSLHNFENLIPVPATLRAKGGVVYRDVTGDIYRHHSPCQRVGVEDLTIAAAELWGT